MRKTLYAAVGFWIGLSGSREHRDGLPGNKESIRRVSNAMDRQRGQEYSVGTKDRWHDGVSRENQSPYDRGGSFFLSLLRMDEGSQPEPTARFSDSWTGRREVGGEQDVVPLLCKLTTQVRGPGTSKWTHRRCLRRCLEVSVRGLSKGWILTCILTIKAEWYPLSSRITSGSYGDVFNSAALEEGPTRSETMLVVGAACSSSMTSEVSAIALRYEKQE